MKNMTVNVSKNKFTGLIKQRALSEEKGNVLEMEFSSTLCNNIIIKKKIP